MAKSRYPEPQPARLSIQQMAAAVPKLERRIKELESFDVGTIRARWDPATEALAKKIDGTLQEILGHGTVEYTEYAVLSLDTLPVIVGGAPDRLPQVQDSYRKGIERAIMRLKTLKELFEERVADDGPHSPVVSDVARKVAISRQVFIVHGRDENAARESVARYLSKLELRPIILHEQPNQSRTIIEKFEAHEIRPLMRRPLHAR